MSRVRASCLLVDNCLKTETKECKRNCRWLFPCKWSCFSHLNSLWAIPTLFCVQTLHVACVLGLYPLSSSFPHANPLSRLPSALSTPTPRARRVAPLFRAQSPAPAPRVPSVASASALPILHLLLPRPSQSARHPPRETSSHLSIQSKPYPLLSIRAPVCFLLST